MEKQADSWLQAAYSDLIVIEGIVNREDISHMVAFHSQQAIEKSFKAVLEEYGLTIPKTHNLITLSKRVSTILDIIVDDEMIDQLNDLYIDSRYPIDIGFLPDGKPSALQAGLFYKFATRIYEQILEKLDSQ
jgi:HEPN domain-containing protein